MSEVVEEKAGEAATVVREIKIEDFVTMVGNMNRFLALLAGVGAFTEAQLGVADWLVLGTVANRNSLLPKTLAKLLRIAPPRVMQIVERLKDKKLLAEADAGDNAVSLTAEGTGLLAKLNASLLDLLVSGLNGRERSFFAVEKGLKPLIQAVSPAKPAREE
jgi:DNA-binding MarR family transcriptional regulator